MSQQDEQIEGAIALFVAAMERSFNRIFLAIVGAVLAFVGAVFAAGFWAGDVRRTLDTVVDGQREQTAALKHLEIQQAAGELPKAASRLRDIEEWRAWVIGVVAREHGIVQHEDRVP